MCPNEEPEFMKVEYKTIKMFHPSHTGVCIEGVSCGRNTDGSFNVPVHLQGKASRMYGLTLQAPPAKEARKAPEPGEDEPEAGGPGQKSKPKGFFAR